MPDGIGYFEALGWLAMGWQSWPGWLLALAAVILSWRRSSRILAFHVLLAAWHTTLLTVVWGFYLGLFWSGS